MSGQARHFLVAGRVPQPDGTVAARRGETRAVGVKRRRECPVGMPLEDTQAPPRGRFPEADRAIAARREETTAVTAEGDRVDRPRVSRAACDGTEGPRLPKDDVRLAGVPAGQPLPVGAEGEWDSLPCRDLLARREVRNTHRKSGYRVVVSHRGPGPVGADREGHDSLARPADTAPELPGRHIPQQFPPKSPPLTSHVPSGPKARALTTPGCGSVAHASP